MSIGQQLKPAALQPDDRILGAGREFIVVRDGNLVISSFGSARVRALPQHLLNGSFEVITDKGILRMSADTILRVKRAEVSA